MNAPTIESARTGTARSEAQDEVLRKISNALAGIRFGSVEIIIHEGKIVQIERKEKVRIEKLA